MFFLSQHISNLLTQQQLHVTSKAHSYRNNSLLNVLGLSRARNQSHMHSAFSNLARNQCDRFSVIGTIAEAGQDQPDM